MRQLLFIVALLATLNFAHAADTPTLKTNVVNLGTTGKLEVPTPPDWTMVYTNVSVPDNPVQVEFHAPSNSIVIRFYIRWDGFGGRPVRPMETDMGRIISNNIVAQYLRMSAEKKVTLEKFSGPAVNGVYARITDADWSPIMKNEYPNFTEGMFRCANVWGNFNLLTFDKDGPQFKAGMTILKSLRRVP